MTEHEKGYLEGLQAAALICQYSAGEKTSHLSNKIMALHNKITMGIEHGQKIQPKNS